MSCIPNTFVRLSFVGSFVQRCEQYAEYDAFICAPDPSNPWITDDVTLWEQDKSLYVSFFINRFIHAMKIKQFYLFSVLTKKLMPWGSLLELERFIYHVCKPCM